MAYLFEDGSVDTRYFTDNRAVGGSGGKPFDKIPGKGAILKTIKLWRKDWRIRAVEVTMSDGSMNRYGVTDGEMFEFTFQIGELLKTIKISASGLSSTGMRRLGAVFIQTDKGRTWNVSCSDLDGSEHYLDVGSGLCCGIFGASGSDVDRLGFAVLWPIKRAVLSNVSYPNLSLVVVATKPDTVATQTFQNNTNINQTFILRGSRSVTTTREWSLSTTLSLSCTVEVSGGIPEVISVGGSSTWEVGAEATYNVTTSITETKEWEWPIECPPHKKIFASATMYSDDITTDYKAKMEIVLNNDKTYEYKEEGQYKGLNIRSGDVQVRDEDPVNRQKAQ